MPVAAIPNDNQLQNHRVVSREERLAARRELLVKWFNSQAEEAAGFYTSIG